MGGRPGPDHPCGAGMPSGDGRTHPVVLSVVEPAPYAGRYTSAPLSLSYYFGVTHESGVWAKAADSLWVDEDLDPEIPPYLPDTELVRQDVRRVYSNIAEMDDQIGLILSQLEQDGLLESTVVVFYGDHGGPLPRQKRLLYDSGLRVPMIIRFPGRQHAGTVDSQLISFVDFATTTFSLAHIGIPDHLEGRAFLGPHRAPEARHYVHAAADRLGDPRGMRMMDVQRRLTGPLDPRGWVRWWRAGGRRGRGFRACDRPLLARVSAASAYREAHAAANEEVGDVPEADTAFDVRPEGVHREVDAAQEVQPHFRGARVDLEARDADVTQGVVEREPAKREPCAHLGTMLGLSGSVNR